MNRIPLVAASVWCMAILAAPLAGLSPIYGFFSIICHQDPSRSWFLAGEALPVCIRCASIYFGFLASLAAGVAPNSRWLKASMLILIAEFVVARLLFDSPIARSVSGMLLGATAAPFVSQGIVELLGRGKLRESV